MYCCTVNATCIYTVDASSLMDRFPRRFTMPARYRRDIESLDLTAMRISALLRFKSATRCNRRINVPVNSSGDPEISNLMPSAFCGRIILYISRELHPALRAHENSTTEIHRLQHDTEREREREREGGAVERETDGGREFNNRTHLTP